MTTPFTPMVTPSKLIIIFMRTRSAVEANTTGNYWSCCDYPQPNTYYGWVHSYNVIDICRTGGHGCDGEQGRFQLRFTSEAGYLFVNINFDGDGNLWDISQHWRPTYYAAPLHVTQRQNTLYLWQIPIFYPEPDLWHHPRNPDYHETEDLERLFPFYHKNIQVCGSAEQSAYNCLAWAIGVTNHVFYGYTPPTIWEVYEFLTSRHIVEVKEENEANIITWVKRGHVTHLSVLVGFPDGIARWTSKLGFEASTPFPAVGMLVSHEINAPEGGPYGDKGAYFNNPAGYQPF